MRKNLIITTLAAVTLMFTSCSSTEDGQDGIAEVPSIPPGSLLTLKPEVGGHNQPNQVYVDLRTNTTKVVRRDSWDFGFYCGEDFRVILNGSVKMSTKALNSTNIDEVQSIDNSILISSPGPNTTEVTKASLGYVDNPSGKLKEDNGQKGSGTAIAEISANDSENKVYLVSMGYEISNKNPQPGSIDLTGEHRGWKKIRILKRANRYLLQYADLADTQHKEFFIEKDSEYNFKFFSIKANNTVDVQPKKKDWDMCFTTNYTYTALVANAPFDKQFVYFFPDLIQLNVHGDVRAAGLKIDRYEKEKIFQAYNLEKANKINFERSDRINQNFMAIAWRKGGLGETAVAEDLIFVVKDSEGNKYKLIFRAVSSESGERGHPVFQYVLLK